MKTDNIAKNDTAFRQWLADNKAIIIMRDGDQWFSFNADFQNLQESQAWFDESAGNALGKAMTANGL